MSKRETEAAPEHECPNNSISNLEWLHEASNPYWDWLWGSRAEGAVQLAAWAASIDSELSERRMVLLREDGKIRGGYLAFSGSELRECRKLDLLRMIAYAGLPSSEAVIARMRESRDLFARVAESEFYLSRIGVMRAERGCGFGEQLLDMVLAEGLRKGFSEFRLDVSSENGSAIKLYRRKGFSVDTESAIEGTAIRYFSMIMSVQ
jgi:ribosomal protein S18 acetylase RimI-like enzyme